MLRYACTVVLLVIALCASTATTPAAPKSRAARDAIQKADDALKLARETYDGSVIKTKKAEVEELKAALKSAMQDSDLEEANSINSLLKILAEDIKTSSPPILSSRWKFRDGTIWLVEANGVRSSADGFQTVGSGSLKGNVMTIHWQSDWKDRLTFEGDKVFKETWKPGQEIDDNPDSVCTAIRHLQ